MTKVPKMAFNNPHDPHFSGGPPVPGPSTNGNCSNSSSMELQSGSASASASSDINFTWSIQQDDQLNQEFINEMFASPDIMGMTLPPILGNEDSQSQSTFSPPVQEQIFKLCQHPEMGKKVFQNNPNSGQSEIVRDQIVALMSKKPLVDTDNLTLTLRHRNPAYAENKITACPGHANIGFPKHAIEIANVPSAEYTIGVDGQCLVKIPNFIGIHQLHIKFLCFSSEAHNSGNKEPARYWKLRVEGTVSGCQVMEELPLQVVKCLRPVNRFKKVKMSAAAAATSAAIKLENESDYDPVVRPPLEARFDQLSLEKAQRLRSRMPDDVLRWHIQEMEREAAALQENTVNNA